MITMPRIRIAICSLLCGSLCLAQPSPTEYENLQDSLAKLDPSEIRLAATSVQLGAASLGAEVFAPESSWTSILTLWAAGETAQVELLWWHKDHPETRALIVALFWSRYGPPKHSPPWPCSFKNFEEFANHFRDGEREQRLKEIEFVRRNLPALKEDIAAILRKAEAKTQP
ncbi:MAG: hypothetical protein IPL39_15500 [Opitutaceae bacterium]|nr:hypothetical protein [Opitutaceae bacterium]